MPGRYKASQKPARISEVIDRNIARQAKVEQVGCDMNASPNHNGFQIVDGNGEQGFLFLINKDGLMVPPQCQSSGLHIKRVEKGSVHVMDPEQKAFSAFFGSGFVGERALAGKPFAGNIFGNGERAQA